jgi:phage minor structural protein
MIPVLFKADAISFDSFGIGALADCISCEVTEERNGAYELALKYPITGSLYKELKSERIIKAKPNDTSDAQAFRIYRITTPLNSIVSVYAQHISYDLANIAALLWSSESISPSLAMQRVFQNTATSHNFTCSTDCSGAKSFSVPKPQSVRACLGGTSGSMLDTWGGEFEWDNFQVIQHRNRGSSNGVVIEYGKNLTGLEQDSDNTEIYTDLLPYAVYTDDSQVQHVVTLTEVLIPITDTQLVQSKTLIKDFTDYFEQGTEITETALRGVANSYLQKNPLGVSVPALTVSFEPLWKSPEYAAVLEKVSLCDTVTVRHTNLGITSSTKVIKTVYDCLGEKYVSITLGSARANFINTIADVEESVSEAVSKVDRFPVLINAAIKSATDKIRGQNGGYVVLNTDANGKPYELLVLDNPSLEQAENVWRWNLSGLGFSSNGYDGPYETAITSDGEIVADFITSGSLTANIIRTGIISSLDGGSWWDLDSGEVHLTAYVTTSELEMVSRTVEGINTEVSKISEKSAEIQTSVDGLNSYVSNLTETVETVSGGLEEEKERVLTAEQRISELQQSVDGLSVKVQNGYVGGINFIRNSAGLNGLTDDWTYSGTVDTDSSTEVQSNTTSDSSFVLDASSTLQQVITGLVTGGSYVFSLRAKKTAGSYSSYARIKYNGSKSVDAFNTTTSFGWQEFSIVIDDVQDSTVTVYIYNRSGSLYVSDMMLAEGNAVHKWTPAPNEIYTEEVKIDHRGIEVSNSASSQRTVITNTEFSGYYNEEKIFTLNKDETQTKKTTVDGELTVGKTKFVPMPTASEGLNIVILD